MSKCYNCKKEKHICLNTAEPHPGTVPQRPIVVHTHIQVMQRKGFSGQYTRKAAREW